MQEGSKMEGYENFAKVMSKSQVYVGGLMYSIITHSIYIKSSPKCQ